MWSFVCVAIPTRNPVISRSLYLITLVIYRV
jgi:hypothetical protein